ncbi:transglutaminase domain-containing protein [Candidatus Woesearchaeota archaeon]|jgi:transglutaminase-like putative cysteine protease|nr:transglutaminase domain-containing protein [Candidatus Woesearchaeota archaeon]MBT7331709.1 transglutaminase domain-containing protein [Candidatus Woesearchaeota archaeon]
MKLWPIVLILLLIPLISAENIYQHDALDLELNVKGEFNLIADSSSASLDEVETELYLYPEDDFRQVVLSVENEGDVDGNVVTYTWRDGKIETKNFGYTAVVTTQNNRIPVTSKIPFPLTNIEGYEEYLQPTENINSNHPDVIAKAVELAEGEDDLFQVAFNLAEWVERNIEYDLNTLTAQAAQPASWVLENKQGVCDEMTSLFVAMARSLGIPARFVSGVSYSNSELFDYPWQPHGWAEVYFPEVGWVSFDITFNEFGYIDVTHIKLRDGFDPAEPATRYQWRSTGVQLETEQLDLTVDFQSKGVVIPEEILLEQEILGSEVGFGSYNLVKGILKNTADYYVATTLQLAIPDQVEVLDRNKRTILLKPREVKETFWVIQVSDELKSSFLYTFPAIIYSEKNESVTGEFTAQRLASSFSQEEIRELTVKDEDKSYSRKVTFDCDTPDSLPVGEEVLVTCLLKNRGNTNLEQVKFCVGEKCITEDVLINQEISIEEKIVGDKAGWKNVLLSAINEVIEKRSSITYQVIDIPIITIDVESPIEAKLKEDLPITVLLKKNSFALPQEIVVELIGPGFVHTWNVPELRDHEELTLILEDFNVARKNDFEVKVTWQDAAENRYSETKEFLIVGKTTSGKEKMRLLWNSFLNLFK